MCLILVEILVSNECFFSITVNVGYFFFFPCICRGTKILNATEEKSARLLSCIVIPYFEVSVIPAAVKDLLLVLCCHHHTNLNISWIFPITAVNEGMLFPFFRSKGLPVQ